MIINTHQQALEIVYLLNHTPLMTRHIGLLPGMDVPRIAQIQHILEIGSGPGGWTREAARTYPNKQITGIDSHPAMISYAHTLSQRQGLTNVHHVAIPHLRGPFLAWPNASFDLISARSLSKMVQPCDWSSLLAECWRLLRPGGWMGLTEFEMGLSNSPAHEEVVALFYRAMSKTGRSFSPTERHLGVLCELEPLMSEARFEQINIVSHTLNYSYGTEFYREWMMDFQCLCELIFPLIVSTGVATQEDLNGLSLQLKREMRLPVFHACLQGVTVWGTTGDASV